MLIFRRYFYSEIKMASSSKIKREIVRQPHHEQAELCTTRARYRQGKKLTAVKVYTINSESQHLLVCGVPSLGLQDELRHLCLRFGDVRSLAFVPGYAAEEFTDVFHLQYSRIQSARYAKRQLDGRSFFGGVLHVCYLPEMESVEETRTKLIQRRREVAARVKGHKASSLQIQKNGGEASAPPKTYHRRKKHPALPVTADRLATLGASETGPACIWKGIPVAIDPRTATPAPEVSQPCGPSLPGDAWRRAGVRERRLVPRPPPASKPPPAALPPAPGSCSALGPSGESALRFVPRPVAINKRIVFHSKRASEERSVAGDCTDQRRAEHLDGIGETLNTTVASVRDKMQAVSVPSMEVVLERDNAIKFGL
ncbi:RNA-binding protein 48 [Bacillus rossius redtenbacheri]|uniref:RNA-binding protein 48 n=1 Tax=Bacillus rossius redtenbacheri TaxID=93214 RepID=UPI002FDDDD4E